MENLLEIHRNTKKVNKKRNQIHRAPPSAGLGGASRPQSVDFVYFFVGFFCVPVDFQQIFRGTYTHIHIQDVASDFWRSGSRSCTLTKKKHPCSHWFLDMMPQNPIDTCSSKDVGAHIVFISRWFKTLWSHMGVSLLFSSYRVYITHPAEHQKSLATSCICICVYMPWAICWKSTGTQKKSTKK